MSSEERAGHTFFLGCFIFLALWILLLVYSAGGILGILTLFAMIGVSAWAAIWLMRPGPNP